MNKLNIKSRIKVEPSTRDSVSTWLDVLTGMLVMPESQRTQVRDELEDHLRSRVDDLLIMGKSEPEAIRIAVTELGETAELAKLITHAHSKTNPRRKLMNTALIAVALGGMSFGGFNILNGTNAPSATPSNGGAVPVVVPEETERVVQAGKTHTFAIKMAPMQEILISIADAFDRKIVFSDDARTGRMQDFLAMYAEKFQGEYIFDEAIRHFRKKFSEGLYGYKLVISEDTILIQSADEYQRSLVETRVYPNPSWITQPHEQVSYAESLHELLMVKFDLEYTSIQIIGDSIVVAAPPNIHIEFLQLTEELDEVIGKRNASMKTKREQAKAEMERKNAEFKRTLEQETRETNDARKLVVDRIQEEFDMVRSELLVTNEKLRLVENTLSSMDVFDPDRQSSNETFEAQVLNLMSAREKLEFEHDETEERYFYLRTRLLESQYANLFEGLE